MGPNGTRWDQVGPGGTKWDQVGPNGTRWDQVGPGGTKWDQVGPGGLRWLQVVSGCPLRPQVVLFLVSESKEHWITVNKLRLTGYAQKLPNIC